MTEVKDQGYGQRRLPGSIGIDWYSPLTLREIIPASQARATAYTYAREALSLVYISASFPCINWKVPICLPNCFRSGELTLTARHLTPIAQDQAQTSILKPHFPLYLARFLLGS